ncbi:MAG TPA: hypothetical protein VJ994_09885 [Paracoccaceae bacterium]|nr:hypothetical protein [Paracoccaceae bacterium]
MSGIRHLPTRIAPAGPAHDPYRGYLTRGKLERSRAVRAAFAALARRIAALTSTGPAAPATRPTRTA